MTNTTEHSDYIPIIRRNGLFLYWIDGDGPRFARLFAETWRQLPLWARRKLLKYWREFIAKAVIDCKWEWHWPVIELVADTSDFHRGNSGDAIGQTRLAGTHFGFKAGGMDTLPDAEVKFTIALELAHALCFAGDDAGEYVSDSDWVEIDADELAEEWGFDRDDEVLTPATVPVV